MHPTQALASGEPDGYASPADSSDILLRVDIDDKEPQGGFAPELAD